jgi:hypothetical protein
MVVASVSYHALARPQFVAGVAGYVPVSPSRGEIRFSGGISPVA